MLTTREVLDGDEPIGKVSADVPTSVLGKHQIMSADYETLAELVKSIQIHGLVEYIVVDGDGEILDGHRRAAALTILDLDWRKYTKPADVADAKDWTYEDKLTYAHARNVDRRHLTSAARKAEHLKLRLRGLSYRRISKITGASHQTVANDVAANVKSLTTEGTPDEDIAEATGGAAMTSTEMDGLLGQTVTGTDGKQYAPTKLSIGTKAEPVAWVPRVVEAPSDDIDEKRSRAEIVQSIYVRLEEIAIDMRLIEPLTKGEGMSIHQRLLHVSGLQSTLTAS